MAVKVTHRVDHIEIIIEGDYEDVLALSCEMGLLNESIEDRRKTSFSDLMLKIPTTTDTIKGI